MAFEPVKTNLPVWNGMSRKNEQGDIIPLEKTEKSVVIGYYLGMDYIQGKDKEIKIHKLVFEECGDPAHLSEPVSKGDEIMIWGSAALDDKLVKNVPIGVLVRVEWLGKVASKANSGQRYHNFDVQIDKEKVLSQHVSNTSGNTSNAPAQQAPAQVPSAGIPSHVGQPATSSPAAMMNGADDDDLPF